MAHGKYCIFQSSFYYYLCMFTKYHHGLTPEQIYGFNEGARRWHYNPLLYVHVNLAHRQMGHVLQEMNRIMTSNSPFLFCPCHEILQLLQLIVTKQFFFFLQSNIEKATFVKLYLVSQGRFPLMNLTDMLSVAVQHREKEVLAWMILHSLYQARIVSHANTGEDTLG